MFNQHIITCLHPPRGWPGDTSFTWKESKSFKIWRLSTALSSNRMVTLKLFYLKYPVATVHGQNGTGIDNPYCTCKRYSQEPTCSYNMIKIKHLLLGSSAIDG